MGERTDSIAEQVAAEGFAGPLEEPRDRDYAYIARKVAERPMPVHYSEDEYEGRGGEFVETMARVHVYRHVIDGFETWPTFARHVRWTDGVADALGLDEPRSRETYRRSWTQQFTGLHHRLQQTALDIRHEIGWGRDGVLLAMGVDDGSQSYAEFSEDGIRKEAKDRAYERIRHILTEVVDFERAENTSVPAEDLTDYAGWLARRQEFPEAMDAYTSEEDMDEAPFDPETFRRAVRNKERERTRLMDGSVEAVPPRDWSVDLLDEPGGTEDWHSTAEEGIERFVAELHDEGIIDGGVPVCIDASIRPWHKHPEGADHSPDGVYQEAYFDTNYGWKDVSATAIIDGRSVVLANVSKVPGDDTFKTVKYLIDRATDLVDVSCFFADAEYANVDILRYIHHNNESYIFKKPHREPVKEEFENFTGKADWTTNFTMSSDTKDMEHDTTLFAVEKRGQIGVKKGETRDEDHKQSGLDDFADAANQKQGQLTFEDIAPEDDDTEYVAFVTNRDIDSEGIDPKANPIGHDNETTVWGHAERYRQRWSIETNFRQVKYQFLPKTSSRDLSTRRFVWMVGLLLYNAWATVNLFVQSWAAATFDDDQPDPPVRAKVLLEEIANIDYG